GRILRTERMRLLEECTMLAGIEWQMGTWAPQARIIEQRPELLRRELAKARGLHLAEAHVPDGSKCRGGGRLHCVLHPVELNAAGAAKRHRARGPWECRRD